MSNARSSRAALGFGGRGRESSAATPRRSLEPLAGDRWRCGDTVLAITTVYGGRVIGQLRGGDIPGAEEVPGDEFGCDTERTVEVHARAWNAWSRLARKEGR